MNFINLIYIITLYNIVFANITLNTPQFIKPAAILDDAVPNQTIFIGFTDSKNGYKTAQMFLIKEGELTKKEFSFNLQKDDVSTFFSGHYENFQGDSNKELVLIVSNPNTGTKIYLWEKDKSTGQLKRVGAPFIIDNKRTTTRPIQSRASNILSLDTKDITISFGSPERKIAILTFSKNTIKQTEVAASFLQNQAGNMQFDLIKKDKQRDELFVFNDGLPQTSTIINHKNELTNYKEYN